MWRPPYKASFIDKILFTTTRDTRKSDYYLSVHLKRKVQIFRIDTLLEYYQLVKCLSCSQFTSSNYLFPCTLRIRNIIRTLFFKICFKYLCFPMFYCYSHWNVSPFDYMIDWNGNVHVLSFFTTWWVSLLVDQRIPEGTCSQVLRSTSVDS